MIEGEKMQRLSARHQAIVPAAPESVWRVLRDWVAVKEWWPKSAPFPILRCEPIGDPATLPFGRRVHLPGGASGDEYLVFADEGGRRLYYYLTNGSLPGIFNYLATTTVDPSETGQSRMVFASTFDAPEGSDAAACVELIVAVYHAIARGVGRLAAD